MGGVHVRSGSTASVEGCAAHPVYSIQPTYSASWSLLPRAKKRHRTTQSDHHGSRAIASSFAMSMPIHTIYLVQQVSSA